MAEKVEVVITIPKHYLEHPQDYSCLAECVRRGIPLPKGRGRLVDMSEVLIKLMQFYDGDKSIGQCLDEVNTIIEADKENKDEDGD